MVRGRRLSAKAGMGGWFAIMLDQSELNALDLGRIEYSNLWTDAAASVDDGVPGEVIWRKSQRASVILEYKMDSK